MQFGTTVIQTLWFFYSTVAGEVFDIFKARDLLQDQASYWVYA